MPSVLFVCTANRFRSPLAAAIFKKALTEEQSQKELPWNVGNPGDWKVGSAGTWAIPGQEALPDVLEAGKQIGIDLSDHRSQQVDGALLAKYDLILVMQKSHREALLGEFPDLHEHIQLLSEVVDFRSYDIRDTVETFQEVVGVTASLNDLIRRGLRYICVRAIVLHNKRNHSN